MQTPDREQEQIDAVRLLWSLCRPVAEIARATGLTAEQVRHIINHGRLPQMQRRLFDQ